MDDVQRDLMRAAAEAAKGDVQAAAALVDPLFENYPDRPDVQMGRGMILLRQGKPEQALQMLMRSLQGSPHDPEALAWAAHLSLSAGLVDQATDLAGRFTKVDPANPRAWSLLARSLRSGNKPREGFQAAEMLLSLDPSNPESLMLKAKLLQDLLLIRRAAMVLEETQASKPYPPAAVELAQIHLRSNKPERALKQLRAVSDSIPANLRPHDLIGQALTELGRYDEAAVHWEMAAKNLPPADVSLRRAHAEMTIGRIEVAEGLLSGMVQRGEKPGSAFQMLATVHRFVESDRTLVDRLTARLDKDALLPEEEARLCFGIGKALDDLADYERAIAIFDRANRILFQTFTKASEFSAEGLRRFTDSQIEFFTEARLEELARDGLQTQVPIFIVGMFRSGTTLTETILARRPDIKAGGEQPFWPEKATEILRFDAADDPLDLPLLRQAARDYIDEQEIEAPERRVTDKIPFNYQYAGLIHGALPQAKFIHLERNPADTLLSIWATYMGDGATYLSDRGNLVELYRQYRRIVRHWQAVLPPDTFRTFRYEDLTRDPERVTAEMIDFLELPPGTAEGESIGQLVRTPSVYQVRQPVNTRSHGRWKHYEPWITEFLELVEE